MEVRTGVVTGSSVVTNADGSEPGRVLQAFVTDQHDVQSIQTCQPGEEYNPPNGAVVVFSAGGSAYKVALALDDGIAPIMPPGGKRLYAVDAQGEAVTCDVQLNPDGTVTVQNDAASVTMSPDGAVTFGNEAGGATLSPAGVWTFHGAASHFDHPVTMAAELTVAGAVFAPSATIPTITSATDVVVAGKSLITHTHTSGAPGSPTGAPL